MKNFKKIKKFKEPERNQQILLTHVDLNSVAPIGSPVWVIDNIINQLDTSDIENTYNLEVATGQKPIHPKTILKVSLFAIHNCRFSLRKMETDMEKDLCYRWLSGDIRIDHSRFGKFLSQHKEKIVKLFSQVVMLATKEGLVDFEVLGIDSLKLRASASYKEEKNLEGLQKEQSKVEAKLNELLKKFELNEEEEEQVTKLQKRERKLKSSINVLTERINKESEGKIESEKKKILKEEEINITDNDAHKMQQRNGEINPSYSTTIAVDTGNDIITNFRVNEKDNDEVALIPVLKGSQENTGRPHDISIHDSGFFSISNLEKLHVLNQFALMPDKMFDVDMRQTGKFARINFEYDKERNCYICPIGVTMNYTSQFHDKNGRLRFRYENPYACARCPHFKECSKGDTKSISRDSNEELKELMRDNLLQEKYKEVYKMRAHSAECPTGHIKQNLKFKTVLRRGIEKIKMEMSLLFSLHNILKIGKVKYA